MCLKNMETAEKDKILIKKCHYCGHLNQTFTEPQKCQECKKSYLPLNYFAKVHNTPQSEYQSLYASSNDLDESEIIKGLTVLW